MKIGVLGNKNKVKNNQTVEEIIQKLESWGYETVRFFMPSDIRCKAGGRAARPRRSRGNVPTAARICCQSCRRCIG